MPPKKRKLDELDLVQPESRAAWRSWLEANHAHSPGVWLVLEKKKKKSGNKVSSPSPRALTLDEAVEEALCFGWIDSLPRKLDHTRYQLFLAPRRPRSVWSAINKRRVERMVAARLMAQAGMEKVDAAKNDGSWDALNASDALEVPQDLKRALNKTKSARSNWDSFPRGARQRSLEWIYAAKREETRERRVNTVADLASKNERAR